MAREVAGKRPAGSTSSVARAVADLDESAGPSVHGRRPYGPAEHTDQDVHPILSGLNLRALILHDLTCAL